MWQRSVTPQAVGHGCLDADSPSQSMIEMNTKQTSNSQFTLPAATCQWPHDFLLQEVVNGLGQLRKLQRDGYRQDEAFTKVFGMRCVRETLRLKRVVLENATTNHADIYLFWNP